MAEKKEKESGAQQNKEFQSLIRHAQKYLQAGETHNALKTYLEALKLAPNLPDLHYQVGHLFESIQEIDNAIHYYHNALHLRPHYADVHYQLALIYEARKEWNYAIQHYESAIHAKPDFFQAFNNLGNLYQEQGNFEKASQYYKEALRIKPNDLKLLNNLALSLNERRLDSESNELYQQILKLDPKNVEVHWNYGQLLLKMGNYTQGWPEYEYRFKRDNYETLCYPHRYPEKSKWKGTSLENKTGEKPTLFIHFEQGRGDILQFVRYIPLAKARSQAKIIFHCPTDLVRLLNGQLEIDKIIEYQQAPVDMTQYSAWISLLSLPAILDVKEETLIKTVPYLKPNMSLATAWGLRLDHLNNKKMRIGIVWAGNPTHSQDAYRSCQLEDFTPLLQIKEVYWISLQKGQVARVVFTPRGQTFVRHTGLICFADQLTDFAETAAVILNLDLIITVDTAVAHLAGALGKPVWLLLPYINDWRWMYDRHDSIWYPSIYIFRQEKINDWKNVFQKASDELVKILNQIRLF